MLASLAFFNLQLQTLSLQQLLIALFLFISAPVTAHMLIKVAMHHKLKHHQNTQGVDKLPAD